jgi:hypothetical protein
VPRQRQSTEWGFVQCSRTSLLFWRSGTGQSNAHVCQHQRGAPRTYVLCRQRRRFEFGPRLSWKLYNEAVCSVPINSASAGWAAAHYNYRWDASNENKTRASMWRRPPKKIKSRKNELKTQNKTPGRPKTEQPYNTRIDYNEGS